MREWGNAVELETRRRIRVAVYAYAYECAADSIVSDDVFDLECYQVDLSVHTNRPDLDVWFRENFQPDTGMWIHTHPELKSIKALYERYYHDR